MSAENRRKAFPWVLGLVVIAFSVIAANRLVGTADAQPPSSGKAANGKTESGPGGLTILGTVDAVPGVVRVDPPSVAGAFSVKEILVEEGRVVAVGDPLIQFDDAVFRAALAEAEAALKEAQWTRFKAQEVRRDQSQLLEKQKLAVEAARFKWEKSKEARARAGDVFERFLASETTTIGGPKLTEAEKERRRKENQDLLKADALIGAAKFELDKEEIDLKRLTTALTAADMTAPADADPTIAAAAVERYTAKVAQAKAAVDACRVTAKVAGTVEHILATPGMLFGPGTRVAAMQIVPSGERIVRAEVDPEFVGRVADKAGKRVTVTDSHHFGHTYEGVVDRVGTSLLAKRNGGDLLTGPPAKVLECRIRLLNPAPSGKPPLVVGQPVRVVFGS